MAADYSYLSAGNGSGDAALMHITALRLTGATIITVDTVTNVPAKFIGTYGTLLSTGLLDPVTKCDFKGHVSGTTLIIDSFSPGSTDVGNLASGQIVIIKPNTPAMNDVVTLAQVSHNDDGSLKTTVISQITTQTLGSGNTATNLRVRPRLSVAASAASLAPNIDTYNQYTITAQAAALVLANPAGTPTDGDIIIVTLKDNGTSQAITYGTAYANISGLDSLIATVIGKWHVLGIRYSAAATQWQILSISTEA